MKRTHPEQVQQVIDRAAAKSGLTYSGLLGSVQEANIAKDIAAYIDLMATETNRPATYDAGIVIMWDEIIARAVIMEDFVRKYPKSNRVSAVQTELGYAVLRTFYGMGNTPAYDYEGEAIDPALNASDDRFTPQIESYLKTALKEFIK
ncbi:hypothetical protein MKZ24_22960 [Paenibacillus sp. FSL R7-0297]|uniref:hypothetical protein n=1 Tax=Paenibacillus sp. FSL R7-0297 TaxID=2921680 RepID=UPI0030F9FC6D